MPDSALDLFDKMLTLDPEKRIIADDALKSQWLKNIEPESWVTFCIRWLEILTKTFPFSAFRRQICPRLKIVTNWQANDAGVNCVSNKLLLHSRTSRKQCRLCQTLTSDRLEDFSFPRFQFFSRLFLVKFFKQFIMDEHWKMRRQKWREENQPLKNRVRFLHKRKRHKR